MFILRPDGGGRGLPGIGGLPPRIKPESDLNELELDEREDDNEDKDEEDDGKNRSRSRSSSASSPFRSAEASSMPSICRRCSFSCSRRLISVSRSVAQSKSVM